MIYTSPMSLTSEFDENDENVTVPLGKTIAIVANEVVPKEIQIGGSTFSRSSGSASVLGSDRIESLLLLLDNCLGNLYTIHKGPNWKEVKRKEMIDLALVYLWYEKDEQVACFVSFRTVNESYGKSLYLYEIHVNPLLQGNKVGANLMNLFLMLAQTLRSLGEHANQKSAGSTNNSTISEELQKVFEKISSMSSIRFLDIVGTGLTVFSDNTRVLKWYSNLGYTFTRDSPVDRVLRGGKVIRPEYYLLFRPL